MPDPTQVDASYQLRGLPGWLIAPYTAGGDLDGSYPDPTVVGLQGQPIDPTPPTTGQVLTWTGSEWSAQASSGSFGLSGINPSVGPFAGSPLTVDHSTGLLAAAGPSLSLELASRLQAGVIGTAGGQQIRGPLYIIEPGANVNAPAWNAQFYSLVIQDGAIAFRSDFDGVQSSSPCTMTFLGLGFGDGLQLICDNDLYLQGCQTQAGQVTLANVNTGSYVYLQQNPYGMEIHDPNLIDLGIITPDACFAGIWPSGPPDNTATFWLRDSTGNFPYYSVNSHAGQYGTLLDGTVVSGGIVTTIGSTHAGGPPTGSASGDLSGTYPSPSIAKLQGVGLTATGASSGQVLTYTGGIWQPAPTGPASSAVYAGYTTNAGAYCGPDSVGNVFVNPAPGFGLGFFAAFPVAQQTALGTTAGFTPNASLNTVFNESTWTGGIGSSAYTIDDLVLAMKRYGLAAM